MLGVPPLDEPLLDDELLPDDELDELLPEDEPLLDDELVPDDDPLLLLEELVPVVKETVVVLGVDRSGFNVLLTLTVAVSTQACPDGNKAEGVNVTVVVWKRILFAVLEVVVPAIVCVPHMTVAVGGVRGANELPESKLKSTEGFASSATAVPAPALVVKLSPTDTLGGRLFVEPDELEELDELDVPDELDVLDELDVPDELDVVPEELDELEVTGKLL